MDDAGIFMLVLAGSAVLLMVLLLIGSWFERFARKKTLKKLNGRR